MNRKKIIIIILFFLCISQCGCLEYIVNIPELKTIIYESHPTTIEYQIKYGYYVDIDGTGKSILHNKEDLPEVLIGSISNITIHSQLQSETVTLADNEMILWNETFYNDQYLFIGISSDVTSQSFLISDLEGTNALNIQEIQTSYPHLINQYCQAQGNKTETIIDPHHPTIQQKANEIYQTSKTNNSFLLAKNIFTWLKTNTEYQIHEDQQSVQPSCDTIVSKNGDCDDLSFLYISLCRSLQIPARFIRGYLISKNNGVTHIIPHVWAEVYVGNAIGNKGWIPVECAGTGKITSEIHQNFAMEDIDHIRLFTDNGSNESLNISTAHISVKYEQDIDVTLSNHAEITNYNIISSNQLCIEDDKIRNFC